MNRKLNVRFTVWLLAGTVLLGVSVHSLHAFQTGRAAAGLLVQADRAKAQGQFNKATNFLSRYLVLVPNDTSALADLGLTIEEFAVSPKARSRAYLVFERVLANEPDRADIRRRQARLALYLERFGVAMTHLNVLLESAPDDLELLEYLVQCQEKQGKFSDAVKTLKKTIDISSDKIAAYERLARLYRRRLDEPQRANEVIEEMVVDNEESASAYLARWRYRREFGLLKTIEDGAGDVSRALELSPNDADALLASADLALVKNELEAARTYLDRGIEQHPKEFRMYQALALLESRAGRNEEALNCLQRGLEAVGDHLDLLWSLASLCIEQNELDKAREVVARLLNAGCTPGSIEFFNARILMSEGQWLQATRLLERTGPLFHRLPELTKQVNLLLGQCYEQLGDTDRQLNAYRRAIEIDPLSIPARIGAGSALLSQGRIDEALSQYRQVTTIPGAPGGSRLLMVRVLVVRNLQLPVGERDWREVEQELGDLASAAPESVEVAILRAESLAAQRQLQQAQEFLESARDSQPDEVRLWTALALLMDRKGDSDGAREVLGEAQERLGDNLELRLARARYWARRPIDEARPTLVELEKDLAKFRMEDQAALLRGLAEAYYRLGDAEKASQLVDQFVGLRPDDLRIRRLSFELATESGDVAKMRRVLNEIQQIEGESGTLWSYGEAVYVVLQANQNGNKTDLARARQLLTRVAIQRPTWAGVPRMLGYIDELERNSERALQNYLRAIELGDRDLRVIRRAVGFLNERYRYGEADQLLRKIQEQIPISTDLQRMAGAISLQVQDPTRAVELARQGVAADPQDHENHLWLGQVLWAVGQRDEAESELRRAVELAEHAVVPWVALVRYLASTEQTEKAEAAIQEARLKLPPDEAPRALALCFEAINRMDQAEEQHRAILAARSNETSDLQMAAEYYFRVGQRQKAEQYLRQILDLGDKVSAQDAAGARRTLALVLVSQGGYQRSVDALALIDKNIETNIGTLADERLKAVLLARRPERRKEAVKLLEGLADRQAATASEKFLLAQLHLAVGNWPKARQWLAFLVEDRKSSNEQRAVYLAQYVTSLMDHGELSEADEWLKRLEQTENKTLRTSVLKARLLKAQGDPESGVALLKTYADGKDEDDFLRVASVLEDLGEVSAEEMYRKYASQSKKPESVLSLAGYLGRQNRLDKALDLCERAWQTCSPEAVANASVTIVGSGNANDEQFQRVDRWLSEAIQKNPKSYVLVSRLADLRTLAGRFQEAESLYRQVIEGDPRRTIALNNLAWLLGFQLGKTSEALRLINRAIEISGPLPDLLDTRATIYLTMENPKEAIKDLEDAVELSRSETHYFHLALAYDKAGNRGSATAALQKAKEGGLNATSLHPLERDSYSKLLAKLSLP